MDKPPANLAPVIYAHRVHELQTVCRSCGYALALHGSMQRDLDAIAVPWTLEAVPAEQLIERICAAMGLYKKVDDPSERPHGRKTWTLLLGQTGFVDLSVMPLKE
jgi:hypothetical protein